MPTRFERAWRILFNILSRFFGGEIADVVVVDDDVVVADVVVVEETVYTNSDEKNVDTVLANRAKAFGLSDRSRRLRKIFGLGRQAIIWLFLKKLVCDWFAVQLLK